MLVEFLVYNLIQLDSITNPYVCRHTDDHRNRLVNVASQSRKDIRVEEGNETRTPFMSSIQGTYCVCHGCR